MESKGVKNNLRFWICHVGPGISTQIKEFPLECWEGVRNGGFYISLHIDCSFPDTG